MTAYDKFSSAASKPVGKAQGWPVPAGTPSKAQLDSLGPLVEGISKLVGTNLSDFVRVKVIPNIAHPEKALVGDGHRDYFRYPSAILTTLYPGGLAEGWHCVGVVHRATGSSLPTSQSQTTMGDMLESLLDQMSALEAFRQAAREPEIALTPLAIYRLLVHR
jgi:hypothetical protein